MRILLAFLLSFFIANVGVAADSDKTDGVLNKVVLSLTQEQWVETKTAEVTMMINASVSDGGIEKLQDEVMKKLAQISTQGTWHLVSFDRSLDQSGLEKVQISALNRLPVSALSGLRDKAKSLSKPGETFSLDSIHFTPSQDELRDANVALRASIYQQAKDEADHLNHLFPDQKYYVHHVDFVGILAPAPIPLPQNMLFAQSNVVRSTGGNQMAVGDKLSLNATVTLASMPDHALFKSIT